MTKRTSVCLSALFAGMLFLGAILFWCLPDKDFSQTENRSLRSFPRFCVETLVSGSFSEDMNEYFADQFPAREFFIRVKSLSETVRGAGENNGILQGNAGQLAKRHFEMRRADGTTCESDVFDPAHIRDAAQNLGRVADASPIPMRILLPPRTIDVTASEFDYPDTVSRSLFALLERELGACSSYLDLLPTLRRAHESGAYVYYKTDHHWTTYGAYLAYRAILSSFGMEDAVIPEDGFCKQTVSNRFMGTFSSAGGFLGIEPDRIEVWTRGNESEFEVLADGVPRDGFYNFSYLSGRDQYALFLDGTHDVVTIRKRTGEARPTLLILKDSFANAAAPFLAQHFDLVLCNLSSPRRAFTDLSALTDAYSADAVLILYTLGNVICTDRMNQLSGA